MPDVTTRELDVIKATPEPTPVELKIPAYMNWFMMITAIVIAGVGIAIVIPPLLSERLAAVWPWPKTQVVVIFMLCLTMVSLVALAHQHRYMGAIHRAYKRSQGEVLEHARRNATRLYALSNVSHMMAASTSFQEVLDHVTRMCMKVFKCDQASLMLLDETQELVVKSVGDDTIEKNMLNARQKVGEGIAGWAAEKRQALLLGRNCDINEYPGLKLRSPSISAAMVVPIVLRDDVVGVLNVSTRSQDVDYDEEDIRALEVFAENVGTCIRHTQQADWMRQTIHSLQKTLKERAEAGAAEISDPVES
ncbi:MAG: GAF domain-containing protein [Candidatus Krumholzibacteriia bacterium]